MDKFRKAYLEEAEELLADIELTLLDLTEGDMAGGSEPVDRIFRSMHTIKGSGSMFGFEGVVSFTHEIETVLDEIRAGIIPVTRNFINLTLSACDHIKKMIRLDSPSGEEGQKLIAAFRNLRPYAMTTDSSMPDEKRLETASFFQTDVSTYRIHFSPSPDLMKNGNNLVMLLDELRMMGNCLIVPDLNAIPRLRSLQPEICYISWEIVLETSASLNDIRDVFIFVQEGSRLTITPVIPDVPPENAGPETLSPPRISPETPETPVPARHVRNGSQTGTIRPAASSIRVSADKLDTLADLVGEMVTVQASLSQKAFFMEDPDLLAIAEQVERLTSELRDNTISIRMVPISTTFGRFRRLIHDLATDLGKSVGVITEGGETELDKTVIERLQDPMIHIIRNSISHGIEAPEVRRRLGKPEKGCIRLSAEHSGASVLIRLADDGAGLDTEAIRRRAVEKGLLAPDAEPSESEIFSLIFMPGFSTARSVDAVSGRGVGMDVVKNGVESIRGSIRIHSRREKGTSLVLKLPLTLAIIDGLLVRVGKTHYVIPLSTVEECLEITHEEAVSKGGRRMVNLRGNVVPYIYLRDLFDIRDEAPEIEQIVIVRLSHFLLGFVVDHILGEHQTVIRNLGKIYRKANMFSGATILADGTVAIILDPHRLAEKAEAEERAGGKKSQWLSQ